VTDFANRRVGPVGKPCQCEPDFVVRSPRQAGDGGPIVPVSLVPRTRKDPWQEMIPHACSVRPGGAV
jgi:hypothetical protein